MSYFTRNEIDILPNSSGSSAQRRNSPPPPPVEGRRVRDVGGDQSPRRRGGAKSVDGAGGRAIDDYATDEGARGGCSALGDVSAIALDGRGTIAPSSLTTSFLQDDSCAMMEANGIPHPLPRRLVGGGGGGRAGVGVLVTLPASGRQLTLLMDDDSTDDDGVGSSAPDGHRTALNGSGEPNSAGVHSPFPHAPHPSPLGHHRAAVVAGAPPSLSAAVDVSNSVHYETPRKYRDASHYDFDVNDYNNSHHTCSTKAMPRGGGDDDDDDDDDDYDDDDGARPLGNTKRGSLCEYPLDRCADSHSDSDGDAVLLLRGGRAASAAGRAGRGASVSDVVFLQQQQQRRGHGGGGGAATSAGPPHHNGSPHRSVAGGSNHHHNLRISLLGNASDGLRRLQCEGHSSAMLAEEEVESGGRDAPAGGWRGSAATGYNSSPLAPVDASSARPTASASTLLLGASPLESVVGAADPLLPLDTDHHDHHSGGHPLHHHVHNVPQQQQQQHSSRVLVRSFEIVPRVTRPSSTVAQSRSGRGRGLGEPRQRRGLLAQEQPQPQQRVVGGGSHPSQSLSLPPPPPAAVYHQRQHQSLAGGGGGGGGGGSQREGCSSSLFLRREALRNHCHKPAAVAPQDGACSSVVRVAYVKRPPPPRTEAEGRRDEARRRALSSAGPSPDASSLLPRERSFVNGGGPARRGVSSGHHHRRADGSAPTTAATPFGMATAPSAFAPVAAKEGVAARPPPAAAAAAVGAHGSHGDGAAKSSTATALGCTGTSAGGFGASVDAVMTPEAIAALTRQPFHVYMLRGGGGGGGGGPALNPFSVPPQFAHPSSLPPHPSGLGSAAASASGYGTDTAGGLFIQPRVAMGASPPCSTSSRGIVNGGSTATRHASSEGPQRAAAGSINAVARATVPSSSSSLSSRHYCAAGSTADSTATATASAARSAAFSDGVVDRGDQLGSRRSASAEGAALLVAGPHEGVVQRSDASLAVSGHEPAFHSTMTLAAMACPYSSQNNRRAAGDLPAGQAPFAHSTAAGGKRYAAAVHPSSCPTMASDNAGPSSGGSGAFLIPAAPGDGGGNGSIATLRSGSMTGTTGTLTNISAANSAGTMTETPLRWAVGAPSAMSLSLGGGSYKGGVPSSGGGGGGGGGLLNGPAGLHLLHPNRIGCGGAVDGFASPPQQSAAVVPPFGGTLAHQSLLPSPLLRQSPQDDHGGGANNNTNTINTIARSTSNATSSSTIHVAPSSFPQQLHQQGGGAGGGSSLSGVGGGGGVVGGIVGGCGLATSHMGIVLHQQQQQHQTPQHAPLSGGGVVVGGLSLLEASLTLPSVGHLNACSTSSCSSTIGATAASFQFARMRTMEYPAVAGGVGGDVAGVGVGGAPSPSPPLQLHPNALESSCVGCNRPIGGVRGDCFGGALPQPQPSPQAQPQRQPSRQEESSMEAYSGPSNGGGSASNSRLGGGGGMGVGGGGGGGTSSVISEGSLCTMMPDADLMRPIRTALGPTAGGSHHQHGARGARLLGLHPSAVPSTSNINGNGGGGNSISSAASYGHGPVVVQVVPSGGGPAATATTSASLSMGGGGGAAYSPLGMGGSSPASPGVAVAVGGGEGPARDETAAGGGLFGGSSSHCADLSPLNSLQSPATATAAAAGGMGGRASCRNGGDNPNHSHSGSNAIDGYHPAAPLLSALPIDCAVSSPVLVGTAAPVQAGCSANDGPPPATPSPKATNGRVYHLFPPQPQMTAGMGSGTPNPIVYAAPTSYTGAVLSCREGGAQLLGVGVAKGGASDTASLLRRE